MLVGHGTVPELEDCGTSTSRRSIWAARPSAARPTPSRLASTCWARPSCCVIVMTRFLIGEIANVLTNFDPALNAYRTSMDNLNQYITERNITTSLKRHLEYYYINSEGLFRKTYHREMLQSLSPALQRAVAKEELGGYVAKLPLLNDTVRYVSDSRPIPWW